MVVFNGYLYIIHLREFINSGQEIYKVGRTTDIFRRFNQYPKGSKLLCVFPTKDPIMHEKLMLHKLCNKFKNRRDIGAEYFEGSLISIMNIIHRVVSNLHSTMNDISYEDAAVQTGVEEPTHSNPFTKFKYTN